MGVHTFSAQVVVVEDWFCQVCALLIPFLSWISPSTFYIHYFDVEFCWLSMILGERRLH